MKKILINFAHPASSRSKINKALRKAVETLEGVTVNDLYANYPDFLIDVEREQKLCEENDIIIFQHPFYWYSTPSIMKEWQDLVLEHGWAYGSQAHGLEGKFFMQAITAGGDEEVYQEGGKTGATIGELTSPYRATASLCKMIWLPPFVVHGIHRGLPDDQTIKHAENYRRMIISLRDGTCNMSKAMEEEIFNHDLDQLIDRG